MEECASRGLHLLHTFDAEPTAAELLRAAYFSPPNTAPIRWKRGTRSSGCHLVRFDLRRAYLKLREPGGPALVRLQLSYISMKCSGAAQPRIRLIVPAILVGSPTSWLRCSSGADPPSSSFRSSTSLVLTRHWCRGPSHRGRHSSSFDTFPETPVKRERVAQYNDDK